MDLAHASVQRRPGADQSLRRLVDVSGLSQAHGSSRMSCSPTLQKKPRSRRNGWAGGLIPSSGLNDAWTLELAGHFHDTRAPAPRLRAPISTAWNDDNIAANQFAGVLTERHRGDRFRAGHAGQWNPDRGLSTRSISLGRTWSKPDVAFPARCSKAVRCLLVPTARESPAQLEGGKVLFAGPSAVRGICRLSTCCRR